MARRRVDGCGGVTDSRESARDKATKATCDRYQTCGLIGSDAGDAYETYDSCKIDWPANWEGAWPVASLHGDQPVRAERLPERDRRDRLRELHRLPG